jgi:signal transduction histidine kinase
VTSRKLARLTFALLLTALALAGALAYQAHDAARSHRATAEEMLRGYAAITAWEVASSARQDLLANHFLLFGPVNRAVAGQILDGRAPLPVPVDTLAAWLDAQGERCGCARGVRFYFRIDLAGAAGDSALTVSRGARASAAELRWIRDTVAAFTRATPGPVAGDLRPRPLVVRRHDGTPQAMPGLVTNFGQASLYGGREQGLDRPTVLAYLLPRTADGRPLAVYGFAADPAAYVAPVLDGVLAKQRLLPPALSRGLPTDALVALAVADGAGRPLYRSATTFPGARPVVEPLEPRYGGLRVAVSLNPAVAERVIPGGLPRSRLPLLVALFGLTAGLGVVALAHLRRQQELARVRADFVSGVSHELRTPLAQIRLLAELLHLGRSGSEDGRRRAARVIDQEARRLSYLVENILAFSRAERAAPGAARLTPGPLDLAGEAAEALELFAPLAAAAGSRVELRAGAGVLARADAAAVRQVLLNFLDNAVRYGPRGQTVVVGVSGAAEGFAREARARLWVEDEGPGVPAAARERVFEAYYRLPRDAAVTGGGSGIGLAVVRDLVRRHGGQVWVEPAARRPGGARFVAEFPAVAPAPARAGSAPAVSPPGAGAAPGVSPPGVSPPGVRPPGAPPVAAGVGPGAPGAGAPA